VHTHSKGFKSIIGAPLLRELAAVLDTPKVDGVGMSGL
jgi:hypothetical protein